VFAKGFGKMTAIRLLRADEELCVHERPMNLTQLLQGGLELHRLGMRADAEALYRAALEQDPTSAHGLHFLAVSRMQQGELFDALELAATAIEHSPQSAAALTSFVPTLLKLATELHDRCHEEAAAIAYELLLAVEPNDPAYIADRCAALLHLGRSDEAIETADRILTLDPDHALAHFARGVVLEKLDRYEQAAECFETSLSLGLDVADVHKRLGGVLMAIGRHEQALVHCEQAIALGAADDDALTNRSLVLLNLGRLAEGFVHYDSRLSAGKSVFRAYACPRWDGTRVEKLLVWGEQGLGDQILYASMLPEMTARVGSAVIEVEPRLVRLLARSFPDLSVVAIGRELYAGDVDAHAPIGSLCPHLRASWDAFPRRERGYLVADPARSSALRERLKRDGRTIVGLSWKSQNPKFAKAKSARLIDFETLLRRPDYRFIDLQYGDTLAERAQVERELGLRIEHSEDIDNTRDIDGLAALMSACDAVVTVSNTTAHLAGALGRPTVVFVPFGLARMWYWFRDRDDSPWYSRVRVKRQHSGQSWADLIATTPDIAVLAATAA
jgi:tetratricopeptide (TPR) repeat protein